MVSCMVSPEMASWPANWPLVKLRGGQSAGLVDDIDQNVGAVLAQGLADGIVDQGLGKGAAGNLEGLGIGDVDFAVGRARWR